jgi:predicted MFS family arabinose efflux permease
MSALAIVLVIRERGGSFGLAGLAGGMFTLADAAISPVKGRLINRFRPAPVLSIISAGQAVLLVVFAALARLGASDEIVVTLACAAGMLLPPVSACSRSLWPDLAGDRATLEAAYAVDAISQELLWTCGPALVAVATAAVSAVLAVVLAALFTVVGVMWFVTAPAVRHRSGVVTPHGRVVTSPGVATLLLSIAFAGVSDGSLALGLPALAAHLGVPWVAGLLLAMLSAGSVAGGLLHGGRSWKVSPQWRYRALLLLAAMLITPLAAASSLAAAFVLCAVAGGAWSALLSCQFLLINTVAPPGTTTVAFAWNTSALVVGIAAGTSLAGVIVDHISVHAPFLLAASALVVASATTFLPAHRRQAARA